MMKKLFLCAMVVIATTVLAKATPQYIMTDCGTVHQIPDNASIDEACEWIDYWSSVDC